MSNDSPSMSTSTNQDHDQHFKVVLEEFFAEFLELAVPEYVELLDCSRVRWADKEAFSHPPEGLRSQMDLLAEVPLRSTSDEGEETLWHLDPYGD